MCVCVCVCVCLSVNRYLEPSSVTKELGGFYKPQLVTAQSLDFVAYCSIPYLSLPATIISAIATTQVHPTTWDSTVSDPEQSIVIKVLCFYTMYISSIAGGAQV